ncbi:hypothetical protein TNCV_3822881 [Trichonephila clavipes]|nr:hypothetical protein TNCV_3822881 [Trichonephila clavipes]
MEHVWDFLGRRLAARTLPPVTIRELRLALQDEWAAMPQQLIDTLILSMGRRCETCLASNIARAMKVPRFNETFPQAELRMLEQAEREAAHRAAETPEHSQARRRRHAEYLATRRAADTRTISSSASSAGDLHGVSERYRNH